MQRHVPHHQEIVYAEPFMLARRLNNQRDLTLFESAQRHEHLGRYSFLAVNPSHTLRVENGVSFLDGRQQSASAFAILAEQCRMQPCKTIPGLPPFQGGWAGYIAYDYGRYLEPKANIKAFQPLCPDMIFHRYDAVVAIDHLQERAWIISQNQAQANELEIILKQKPQALGPEVEAEFVPVVSQATHENNVAKTVEYILAGDIFQANITQIFQADIPSTFDAYALYKQLREKNPAPFAALLNYKGITVISSSPERLIRYDGKIAEARPIKGTRRRDADPERDATLVADLMASPKDRAENVMIVDLLRNDLSRVSKPRTVKVPVLCGLETYANVHHLVSVVQGELADNKTVVELLAAVFPGGSITGAPKVRAMEIISELEQSPRGVYCGAMGYLGFNGTCDFNIAIRTLQVAGGVMRLQGGGGITARSDPLAEYEESLVKVQRLREALRP